jgi:hypothetical protein
MNSRQLEQAAQQHTHEMRSAAAAVRPVPQTRPLPRQIRRQTGWALVALGLRLAESGTR